jgi:hypothetical protein
VPLFPTGASLCVLVNGFIVAGVFPVTVSAEYGLVALQPHRFTPGPDSLLCPCLPDRSVLTGASGMGLRPSSFTFRRCSQQTPIGNELVDAKVVLSEPKRLAPSAASGSGCVGRHWLMCLREFYEQWY